MRSFVLCSVAAVLVSVSPAFAQDGGDLHEIAEQPLPSLTGAMPQVGQTAEIGAGRVGQRKTREQAAQELGIGPMTRVSTRIQNRVQSRIRNRIDRYYDPQANAASPFEIAGEQARTTGMRRGR